MFRSIFSIIAILYGLIAVFFYPLSAVLILIAGIIMLFTRSSPSKKMSSRAERITGSISCFLIIVSVLISGYLAIQGERAMWFYGGGALVLAAVLLLAEVRDYHRSK